MTDIKLDVNQDGLRRISEDLDAQIRQERMKIPGSPLIRQASPESLTAIITNIAWEALLTHHGSNITADVSAAVQIASAAVAKEVSGWLSAQHVKALDLILIRELDATRLVRQEAEAIKATIGEANAETAKARTEAFDLKQRLDAALERIDKLLAERNGIIGEATRARGELAHVKSALERRDEAIVRWCEANHAAADADLAGQDRIEADRELESSTVALIEMQREMSR